MTQMYYTVDDFQKLMFEGKYALTTGIMDIIHYLEQNIVIPSETVDTGHAINRGIDVLRNNSDKHDYNDRSTNNRNRRSGSGSGSGSGSSPMSKRYGSGSFSRSSKGDLSELDNTHVFKTTKIQIKEGVEKQLNDIRGLLNKISVKNYDSQKNLVIEQIIQIIDMDDGKINIDQDQEVDLEIDPEKVEIQHRIVKTIFDIASESKFLSEMYSNLYLDLCNRANIFKEILDGSVKRYKETLYEIHYVDVNVDYDGFCNYNKTNDTRKSMASFIVNLMKRGLIPQENILETIVEFQELTFTYIDNENRMNEVDEITENVALLLTMCKPTLQNHPLWVSTISPNIKKMTTMKAKEHKSLSSRVVFKYMDF